MVSRREAMNGQRYILNAVSDFNSHLALHSQNKLKESFVHIETDRNSQFEPVKRSETTQTKHQDFSKVMQTMSLKVNRSYSDIYQKSLQGEKQDFS